MAQLYRNDRTYVAKREALKRQCKKRNTPCAYCGKAFYWEREGTSEWWKDAMSFTANHIEAVGNGGSMTGPLEPMHRGCNSRLGKKPLGGIAKRVEPRTSRQW